MVVDKSTDSLARCFQLALRTLFPQSPIILVRYTERTFYFSFFIFLECYSVRLIFHCDNKLLCLPYPIAQINLAGTMIYPSVFQLYVIPRVASFSFFRSFHADNFQFMVFLTLRWILFLLFSTQLIIASFLVEIKQYPSQLLFLDRLRKCFLPQVIERPIKRNLPPVCDQCRLMRGEVFHHLVE